ncbi:MAG TPA: thiamine pyrophosphate-binding protein [Candidatus Limnocylindria bacterium]|nr:thiamine pyrophosphate-binding protein [Candidatus Limnocylindria bacterium]
MATTANEGKKEATGPVISGGHLVAKALKNEGVEVIWTLCGGHIIDIYDGCIDEGIKIIDVRHEQVAAHAADGYSRQSGKIGCVVTTAGPGTTNAMTGIANAFRAESPLVMIGGQGALSQHKMGSLQDLPHVDIMAPITKFAASVPHTERVADMVSMAFREAVNGAPGPSYLEIPRDVLDAKVPLERARIPKPGAYRASTKSIGDPADIEKLADILVNSERPCALFGTQVWTSRGHDDAVSLCRALNMPGYMNGSSRGIFAPEDPHGFNRTRRMAFDKADVILIVGCPFDFRLGYGRRLRADATVVQIDLDYRNVGKNRDISLGLVGDCGAILKAVEQAASGRVSKGNAQRAEWMKELRAAEAKAYEKLLPSFKSESTPINPYRVAYEINEFLTDNTVYIGDGGDVVTITATAVEPRKAGNWMDPGPLGTLGVGTSFSMATKFVHPQKEVLCYYGDGSFGMTAWDMETAQRFKLPYMAVIGNNSAMNQIRCGQIGKYGPERGCVGNKLGDVDFEKFADCFGGWGIAVREPSQIRPALEKARERVAGGQCAIVNIWVDINEYAPGTKAQTMYK